MAKRVIVAARRKAWAAQARKEREARQAPGEARLAWLARPSVRASHSAAWLRAQQAACKAALAPARTRKAKA